MPIPTMHQPTPTSTRARYHAAPQGGAAVGGGQRLPPPRASPAPSTRQRNLAQLTSFCPAPPGHLGKPANESGMQGWQLATPQSYALLRMFAYATLLCTHAVYCLQHPCRPSSSCCTSAVWACVCVFGVCVYVLIYIYIYICYMYICMYIYIYSVILYIYIFSLSFSCSHSFSLSTHAHTCTHTHTHTHAPGCSTAHRPPGAHLPQP
jgi:hypothetical protein